MITFQGKVLKTYPEIIEFGLSLTGEEQERFVEAVAQLGPYSLQNIGYVSGYYSPDKADRIQEVFKTAHPIFGRRHPSPEEAIEKGRAIGAETLKGKGK